MIRKLLTLACAFAATKSAADVTVMWRAVETDQYVDITNEPDVVIEIGVQPDVTLENRGGFYWIYTDESGGVYEPLGKVIFVEGASGDSHTYLLITSDENPTSGQAEYSTPGAGDWLGLDENTEVIVLRGRILGNLNDDIECDWVKSLFVDGSIPLTSNVFHYGSEMDGSMSITVVNGDLAGNVILFDGDLNLLRVIDAPNGLTGVIYAQSGDVFEVIVQDCDVSGFIQAGTGFEFSAPLGINSIEVIRGNITGGAVIRCFSYGQNAVGFNLVRCTGDPLTEDGGNIGEPGYLAGITSQGVGIGSIECEQLHANIQAVSHTFPLIETVPIENIEVTGDPANDKRGDWSGFVGPGRLAAGATGRVYAEGAVSIVTSYTSTDPSNPPDAEIEFDGLFDEEAEFVSTIGLESGTEFRFDGGLAGQVVLAAGWPSHPNPQDSWDGDVSIKLSDSTVQTFSPSQSQPYRAPHYHAASSQLGGGAIGLAPFNFHQRESAPPAGENRDCDPYQNEVVQLGPADTLDSVIISHYGPVYIDTSMGGPYFKVEWKLLSFRPWEDRTSLFQVDTALTAVNDVHTLNRNVVIQGTTSNPNGFKSAGYWRIRPYPGKVKCAKTGPSYSTWSMDEFDVQYDSSITGPDAGTSSPSFDWYGFQVMLYGGSGGAFMSGGTVTWNDVQRWPDEPYETNADGSTNTTDLGELIEALDE